MQQDVILVFDLGSEENPKIAREIRALGVYSEIHPHDLTAAQLAEIPNIRGIILNGGKNRVVNGVAIDASDAIYALDVPVLAVDHEAKRGEKLAAWPADDAQRSALLSTFLFDTCHCGKTWNTENFIEDRPHSQAGWRWQGAAGAQRRRGFLRRGGAADSRHRRSAHLRACKSWPAAQGRTGTGGAGVPA